MKKKVFVSYSSEHKNLATPIVELLRLGDQSVFIDRNIKPGDKWEAAIWAALDDATHVVVIWCHHAASSKWVNDECDHALALNKTLIPVRLDQTKYRSGLADFQGIDFTSFFNHDELRPRQKSSLTRNVGRRIMIIVALICAVMFGATTLWLSKSRPLVPDHEYKYLVLREALTWRPPGGENVNMDQARIAELLATSLQNVVSEVKANPGRFDTVDKPLNAVIELSSNDPANGPDAKRAIAEEWKPFLFQIDRHLREKISDNGNVDDPKHLQIVLPGLASGFSLLARTYRPKHEYRDLVLQQAMSWKVPGVAYFDHTPQKTCRKFATLFQKVATEAELNPGNFDTVSEAMNAVIEQSYNDPQNGPSARMVIKQDWIPFVEELDSQVSETILNKGKSDDPQYLQLVLRELGSGFSQLAGDHQNVEKHFLGGGTLAKRSYHALVVIKLYVVLVAIFVVSVLWDKRKDMCGGAHENSHLGDELARQIAKHLQLSN